ncbi:MAG TPA: hypothetical protein VE567_06505, partial [Sphingomonas sp.]|nr:hypothetical protein [Sphingomonas sp.]
MPFESAKKRAAVIDLEQIEHVLAVVEACLCETFPQDFFRRCAFAAFGLRALLQDAGIDAVLVGGQFAALVVTPEDGRLALQGFKSGPDLYPHLWVEAADRLIDLGPYLLAFGSDYPVVPMPFLAWSMSAPLPGGLRYKAQRRLPAGHPMSNDSAVNRQCDAFVDRCLELAIARDQRPRLPGWIATDYATLLAAAGRDDPWARGAMHFEQ